MTDAIVTDALGRLVPPEPPKPDTSPVKVGDIFVHSWGYSMVIVDFYQVKRLAGKTQVVVQEIRQEQTATGYLQGRAVPVPGAFVEPDPFRPNKPAEFRKRVRIGRDGVPNLPFEFGWCERWDGQPEFFDHCD